MESLVLYPDILKSKIADEQVVTGVKGGLPITDRQSGDRHLV